MLLGIPLDVHNNACVVIDKIDKLPEDKLIEELQKIGVTGSQASSLLALVKVNM